jgi:hypothetical protein
LCAAVDSGRLQLLFTDELAGWCPTLIVALACCWPIVDLGQLVPTGACVTEYFAGVNSRTSSKTLMLSRR